MTRGTGIPIRRRKNSIVATSLAVLWCGVPPNRVGNRAMASEPFSNLTSNTRLMDSEILEIWVTAVAPVAAQAVRQKASTLKGVRLASRWDRSLYNQRPDVNSKSSSGMGKP